MVNRNKMHTPIKPHLLILLNFLLLRSALACTCLALIAGAVLSPTAHGADAPLTAGLEFSGGAGQVVLDDGFSLAGRSFTVEAWVWLDSIAGDQTVLGHFRNDDNPLHLTVRDGRVHLGFWADDLTGDTVAPAQQWVHVAYAYDATTRTQQVFLNGVLDGERTAEAHFAENNQPLRIGIWFAADSSNFLRGRMLELRIWDHVRTEAAILADRTTTPLVDAPGLEALFTFEGIAAGNVPEASGNLTGNTLAGAVTVVEPVLAPAALSDPALTFGVPVGSLDDALTGYTALPAPAVAFPDSTGNQLSDGLAPLRVWGTPWLDFSGPHTDSLVAWQNAAPELTFQFSERVRVDAITLYAANSGGASGFALPTQVHLDSPGGYAGTLSVVAGPDIGTIQPIVLGDLGLLTDELTLTLEGTADWLALAEVSFDGAVLAERPAPGTTLPLLAQRFFGVADAAALPLAVVPAPGEVRFHFPQAADPFGVEGIVEWSTDLQTWQTLPHQAGAVPGEAVATLTPLPAEGRAFFRVRLESDIAGLVAPSALVLGEKDTPFQFPAGTFLGTASDPAGPDGLSIVAINDRAATVGEAIALDFGGSLQIEADGSGTLTVPASMPGGATLDEVFSYTVINRLGKTERRSFTFTITGENDPPSVDPIALSHASGVEPAGTAYRYFEGDFPTEASLLAATPTATGRQPTFSLAPAAGATGGFGLEMTGELFVPASGPYTFFLTGNNTAVLDVGGTRVIAHDAADRSGTVELTAGTHSVRVLYFDTTDPAAELTVDYVGPGFIREAIPADAFPRLTAIPLDPLAGASDPDAGDVLTISHIDGQPIAVGAPVLLPTGAAVQLNGDGTLTYFPAPGRTVFHEATDTDSFTYTVSDSGGLSASAAAEITLARVNTAPLANAGYGLSVATTFFGQVVASDAASDADGDLLRITHVNGLPLVGGEQRTLPTTARVSLSSADLVFNSAGRPPVPFGLRYDALNSFLLALDQTTASDAFTITITDSAGAVADVSIAGTWPLETEATRALNYADSRFDAGLGPRTVRIFNDYRFAVEALVSVTDRQTGTRYGQVAHTFGSKATDFLTFDLPAGIDLEGAHFFDRFDLEIDRADDGMPLWYGVASGNTQLEALYSTASQSFFRLTGATSPHWPFQVVTSSGGGTFSLGSGVSLLEVNYGAGVSIFRLGILNRGERANKNILEPTFASNLIVQGICRTATISRFSIENRNDEAVPLTVGSGGQVFAFDPGQTRIIEVPYEPEVPIKVLQADLGLFDSNEVTCPLGLSFTVTPLCSEPFFAFVGVRNNNPTESFTVRVESVNFPTIRSDPQVIGNQAEEFVQVNTQGTNLAGTEGRIVVILPGNDQVVETFIFSDNDC